MSLQVSARALSPALPPTLNAQQETASNADGEPSPTSSTEVSIHQQQTAEATNGVKKTMSSNCQAPSLNHLQLSEPSNSTKDQLPKLITGLDDKIRQSKPTQDAKREVVKHTLLQEELAQLREENLNLRVDLQLARDKHQLLESQHNECKKRKKKMGKAMKKAIRKLSTGLDLPEGGSADPELTTGSVVAGLSLPPQRPADDPTVEKSSSTLIGFQAGITGSTDGGTTVQAKVFGQSLMTNTSPGFFGSLGVNKPLPSLTGDPARLIQAESKSSWVIMSTPGSYNGQEQSFEEARLRRYAMSNIKAVQSQIPKGLESFGSFNVPARLNSLNGRSSSKRVDQQSIKRKIGNDAEDREEQTPGSTDVAGAKGVDSFLAGTQGAPLANMTPAISDTGKIATTSPFQYSNRR